MEKFVGFNDYVLLAHAVLYGFEEKTTTRKEIIEFLISKNAPVPPTPPGMAEPAGFQAHQREAARTRTVGAAQAAAHRGAFENAELNVRLGDYWSRQQPLPVVQFTPESLQRPVVVIAPAEPTPDANEGTSDKVKSGVTEETEPSSDKK